MPGKGSRRRIPAPRRAHVILIGVLGALAAGIMFFDWNWLRGPLVNYLAKTSGREVRVDDLQVALGWPLAPTVRLRGVYVQNAEWSSREPLATAGEVAFTLAWNSLWSERIMIKRLELVDADINLHRKADGLRNWRLTDPEDRGPGAVRIMTLAAQRSKMRFVNDGIDLDIVATTAPADAAASADALPNHLTVNGKYQGVKFSGAARIGTVMSFRASGAWFPIRGYVAAGKTRLDIDGRLADIFDLGPVDAKIRLAGDTLSNFYPFLKFKPPPTRAFRVEAKVSQENDKYVFAQIKGKFGDSDIAGDASYDRQPERPVATANLRSGSAELADLVFLAGMDYHVVLPNQGAGGEAGGGRPAAGRALHTEPLQHVDAHVKLDVKKLRAGSWPVDSLQLAAALVDGMLTVNALDVGAAGGHIVGSFEFEAKAAPPVARATLDARNLRLERLLKPRPNEVASAGAIRSHLQLSAHGKSFSAMLANATGTLAAVVEDGVISNLADAKLALNLGKALGLRLGGDRAIALYCGAVALDFRAGIGKSKALVLETEQTHTDGAAVIDLRDQKFELVLTPQPKKPGIFTLNSSIRVQGAFKDAGFKIDDRVPLREAGAAASPATIANLFRPLLSDRRATGSCTRVLTPVRTPLPRK